MGFYLRKAVSVGPFRFNLSKSGVGVSVGVKGFRIGAGPRGNYVHMGRGGLYYRATLNSPSASGPERPAADPNVSPANASPEEMRQIESASTETIVDSSSAEVVAEMNVKRQKVQWWPLVVGFGLALGVYLANVSAPAWTIELGFGITAVAALAAAFHDKLRKTTVLLYELDSDVEQRYQKLHDAFQSLGSCGGCWNISARGDVRDPKYHAGASSVIKRSKVRVSTGNPPFVKSNLTAPSVPVGRRTLYFFPDKVLVFEPNSVGAVSYKHLLVSPTTSRFVEEEGVPNDAQIVDRTWRYVNKTGDPDRRFKNNRELPIALYENISFTSDTGLNQLVQVSRVGMGKEIADSIRLLATVADSPEAQERR